MSDDKFRALIADVVREVLAERDIKPANDELLTTSEAAEIAKVTAATVRRWVRTKKLHRHGPGQVRVRRAELERLITTGRSEANLTPQERARKRVG